MPKVSSLPLKAIRPREAIERAAISAPTPRADWRKPLVAELPPKMFTAHAGSSVLKLSPKSVPMIATTIKIRITWWLLT